MGGFFYLLIGGASLLGWLVHVFTCLKLGMWGFLIAGALLVPIGVIHGWGLMLGFW